ncbi:helix-turn-helix transcriptional regulator [Actinopolymorpha pittospori]|uniref:DNA-binding transcriptional regulator AlpA n=1 Tax=Actinopolymorpha pittospori TaxID=648752 RepID=A0A927RCI3_9ACTN|nr:hypothetical protein [Actinopolymorpha pittospori]MBE1609934.1 putative DNA-binding transcriptional regulator AlpA [Actinopolymorpha pittospori]
MALYQYRAVANGLGTDHPIPDLPFVDDSHIPLDDPAAIEAVSRKKADDMWGRKDVLREEKGWVAFTTDPQRRDLAWCVRWHREHGRSVVLYKNEDVSGIHTVLAWETRGEAQLFRAGGYCWDGTRWYRPSQVWDAAREEYVRRPVPAAVTVSVADLLVDGGDPARGRVLEVGEVEGDESTPERWLDELALWAKRRPGDRPLPQCVVTLAAPELTGDQLVGVPSMAEIAGIAASTLRAYISRGEEEVPLPQATVAGRSVWSRPVVQEWVEQRQRSPEAVIAAVTGTQDHSAQPPGVAELWDNLARSFHYSLWERPQVRKRWALRWRKRDAVRDVAENLAWNVAASLDTIVPTRAVADTIKVAVLNDFASQRESLTEFPGSYVDIQKPVAEMFDWLVRHHPVTATATFNEIVGWAERNLEIPSEVSVHSLSEALKDYGKLDRKAREDFVDRSAPPARNGQPGRASRETRVAKHSLDG